MGLLLPLSPSTCSDFLGHLLGVLPVQGPEFGTSSTSQFGTLRVLGFRAKGFRV